MTRVYQITPFLHVPDMVAALQFFCETLPFEVKYREHDYAYLELAGCGLRLLEEKGRVRLPDGKARVTVYVDVADVDALYTQLSGALGKLPPGSFEGVTNRPWKQRELQVRLPDGDWITFGQAIPEDNPRGAAPPGAL